MNGQTGRLQGKVALVTGAGRGIGKAVAIAYAKEGAAVSCAARTQSQIDTTMAEIESAGGQAIAVRADVADLQSVRAMVDTTVRRFGGIDILVANAGGNFDRSRVEDGDPADWLTTLNVNLVGAYYCARESIPYLKQRQGAKIITVGSGIGHNGRPASSAYASAKAGLWMLTRVLAQELWEYGISVNELIPGPVMTERVRESYQPGEGTVFDIGSEWVKGPEDVAPLALFLATQPDVGPTAQSFSLMRRDT